MEKLIQIIKKISTTFKSFESAVKLDLHKLSWAYQTQKVLGLAWVGRGLEKKFKM